MTELAVFSAGSLVFLATTWATVAFGVSRVHQEQALDIEASEDVERVPLTALTEVHATSSTR